jgi:hypothetical protein
MRKSRAFLSKQQGALSSEQAKAIDAVKREGPIKTGELTSCDE